MMNEDTVRKLIEMKMSGMVDYYKQQSQHKDYQFMDFEERFMILVDTEYSRRKSNKLQRLINQAKFDIPGTSISEILYFEDRKSPKELILRLVSGVYLENKNNRSHRRWKDIFSQYFWHRSLPPILQSLLYSITRASS